MNHYTPDNITELAEDEIFVFGSNAQGNHAGGAARTAVERFGAIEGQAEGLQGQSYAIPTMDGLGQIYEAVTRFVEFAKTRPELLFYVTKIGTGIAGHREGDVATLFGVDLPNNVRLPLAWDRHRPGLRGDTSK
jgi:hypothetical protein